VSTADSASLLRRGILALLVFGCVGLLGELVLLEHYTELYQLPPIILLTLTLVTVVWHWTSGSPASLKGIQIVALLLVVAGTVGMFLHLGSNYDFERELEPDLTGMPFWTEVIRGDTPTLAPGTLIQFGLLALLYAYRHPARKPPGA
jgi:hypothetical protein